MSSASKPHNIPNPEVVKAAVQSGGGCGEVSPDGLHACVMDIGHAGRHGWESNQQSSLHVWRREPGGWHVSDVGEIVNELGWYLRLPYSERRILGTTAYLTIGPFTSLAKAKDAAEELAGCPAMQEVLRP